jgi:hypothetical protein
MLSVIKIIRTTKREKPLLLARPGAICIGGGFSGSGALIFIPYIASKL